MNKVQKRLPIAVLASVPLAIHRLYRTAAGFRRDTNRMQPLPRISLPANDFYLAEADFARQLDDIILPYLKEREETGTFQTEHRIHYAHYKADEPKATIVISHGYGETISRHWESVYYFLKMGFDVYIPEHFGHGESEAGVEDPSVIWVEDFNIYTFDFYHFVKQIVCPTNRNHPVIIYGHSMGGAILGRALEEYPDLCDAAIFTSPMFQVFMVKTDSLISPLIQFLAKSPLNQKTLPGKARMEKLNVGDFNPEKIATHSVERGRYFHYLKLNGKTPPRWLVSWGWVNESLKATKEVVKQANVEKINIPMLMFQSGRDLFVDPRGMFEFAEYARDLEFYKVEGSFHEIYSETNDIIIPYFNKINEFISRIIEQEKTTGLAPFDHKAAIPIQ